MQLLLFPCQHSLDFVTNSQVSREVKNVALHYIIYAGAPRCFQPLWRCWIVMLSRAWNKWNTQSTTRATRSSLWGECAIKHGQCHTHKAPRKSLAFTYLCVYFYKKNQAFIFKFSWVWSLCESATALSHPVSIPFFFSLLCSLSASVKTMRALQEVQCQWVSEPGLTNRCLMIPRLWLPLVESLPCLSRVCGQGRGSWCKWVCLQGTSEWTSTDNSPVRWPIQEVSRLMN